MKRARVLAVAMVAALVVGAGGIAFAQYPIDGVDDCAESFDGDGDETTTFSQGGDIQVRGAEGCADPNEEGIEAILESDPVLLARFDANADGSYTSPVATIPSDTDPGRHEVIVRTEDNEYVQPITVTAAGVPAGLPETGRNIALLALWGTLSLILGSVLVTVSWRRWQEARVAADAESAWISEASALGTLDDREAAPYRPPVTEWIDAPRLEPEGFEEIEVVEEFAPVEDPAETTAEIEVAAFEAALEGIEEPEAPAVAEELVAAAPSNGNGRPAADAEEVVRRAATRTSEIVDRLRDEIASWRT